MPYLRVWHVLLTIGFVKITRVYVKFKFIFSNASLAAERTDESLSFNFSIKGLTALLSPNLPRAIAVAFIALRKSLLSFNFFIKGSTALLSPVFPKASAAISFSELE